MVPPSSGDQSFPSMFIQPSISLNLTSGKRSLLFPHPPRFCATYVIRRKGAVCCLFSSVEQRSAEPSGIAALRPDLLLAPPSHLYVSPLPLPTPLGADPTVSPSLSQLAAARQGCRGSNGDGDIQPSACAFYAGVKTEGKKQKKTPAR